MRICITTLVAGNDVLKLFRTVIFLRYAFTGNFPDNTDFQAG